MVETLSSPRNLQPSKTLSVKFYTMSNTPGAASIFRYTIEQRFLFLFTACIKTLRDLDEDVRQKNCCNRSNAALSTSTFPHNSSTQRSRLPCRGVGVGTALCGYSSSSHYSLGKHFLKTDPHTKQKRKQPLFCLQARVWRPVVLTANHGVKRPVIPAAASQLKPPVVCEAAAEGTVSAKKEDD